ncbi:TonB-dependent receptor [Pelobium manganitolerans]|uniref:TonB-dependent receptor n=1 Tax=Pelobium manganitolerans TaxID=1842495 RepID=A0A419S645_9SPHI|nr:TonB-dependent receptor [Pelobium manganitolerans]RKD16186.1 TonB-dependent receptor [Pelobium manganitolerans]
MRKLYLLLLLFCTSLVAFAQSGNLSGRVISLQNEPLNNASVRIPELKKGAVTAQDGSFEIKDLPSGTYSLRVSIIGYSTKNISVKIDANQTTFLNDIQLAVSNANNLNEVTVTGNKANKYGREMSSTVSKMPLKDLENPQVYNSISGVLLKEQVVTNFDDALKNAPGIDKLWESTGRGGDGAGYFSLRGFAVQPTLVNGVPALTNGSPDIANVESIEVVKGPSGTLYGSSLISYGGLININTKRPFYGFGGSISYTTATYGLNRVTADVNTTLGSDNNAAFRINTAYNSQASFQDAGFKRSLFVAPALRFDVNERLSFDINTEFFQGKSTNQTMLFVDRGSPLRVHNIAELGYNRERSYTSNDLYMETPTYSLQGQMNYKLSGQWTSQTVVSKTSARSEGYYSYLYEVTSAVEGAPFNTPIPSGIILRRSTTKQNNETIGLDIQQNFLSNFSLGTVKNKLLVGLDYFNRNEVRNDMGYGIHGFVNLGVDPAIFQSVVPALHNFYNIPVSTTPDDSGVLTQAGADAGILASYSPGPGYGKTKQQVYSAYASDVITFTPALSAMASLRVDRFSDDSYHQVSLSPKFGVVYQPILNKLSLFGNFMDGFSNVAPGEVKTNGVASSKSLKPEHARQFEFGTKMSFLTDKFTATLSYYDIKVNNRAQLIEVDPDNSYYVQNGEQYSKGFEMSVIANPINGLNFVAGYSYNEGKQLSGDPSFIGFRPEEAGPAHLANFWASYRFSSAVLDGFGLGFGGNYASENKIFNRTNGTFTLPAYTILNASAFYDVKAFRFTLKLDNLTNKDYYKGWSTISPQAPRVFSADLTYRF